MSDKDLRIQITTAADTSGADAAAAALGKVEAATKAADGGGVDISELNERMEKLKQRAEYGQREAEKIRQLGEESEAAAPKLGKLISLERLEAMARLGAEAERFGRELARLGPEGEAAAETMTRLGSAVTGFAEGMRMGGPIGGVLGAGMALLKKPYDDMIEATDDARRSEETFQKVLQQSIDHRQELAAKRISKEIIGNLQEETEAAMGLALALGDARRVRAAKEAADDAVQENRDAIAAARGESPQDKASREIENARERAARDKRNAEENVRDLARAAAAAQAAAQQARYLFPGMVAGGTAEEREIQRETEAAVRQKEAAAAKLASRLQNEEAILPENLRAIEARMQGKIQASERDRLASEAAAQRQSINADTSQWSREIAAQERAAAAEESARGGRLGLAGESMGMAEEARRRGAPFPGVQALQQKAAALTANPTAQNEKALHDVVDRLLAWAEASKANSDGKFSAFHARIAQLERSRKLDSR